MAMAKIKETGLSPEMVKKIKATQKRHAAIDPGCGKLIPEEFIKWHPTGSISWVERAKRMKEAGISDPADKINTSDDVIACLQRALEKNDPEHLLYIFGDIVRSKGMVQISKELHLNRQGLYKAFSAGGNPSFKTVLKLLDVLGLRIKLEKKSA